MSWAMTTTTSPGWRGLTRGRRGGTHIVSWADTLGAEDFDGDELGR